MSASIVRRQQLKPPTQAPTCNVLCARGTAVHLGLVNDDDVQQEVARSTATCT